MTNKLLLVILLLFSLNAVIGQTLDTELLELKFSNDGYPERFTKAGNGFYFTVDDTELWYTDGTVEGTHFFSKSTNSGDISLILPREIGVFFIAEKDYRTDELWVSDGTEEGTVKLTERSVGYNQGGAIRNLIVFNNKVYFSAFDETLGTELWVSDGTVGGTNVLKDINGGEEGSDPFNFFSFNGYLFFKAYTEELGIELWQSDGTPEGTLLFKDINPGTKSSVAGSINYARLGDSFYFFANNGTTGSELWKSDGTPEGTILLKDINQTFTYGSSNTQMFGGAVNGNLVFLANDGVTGNELWISDGTEEGTKILKDIAPGIGSGIFSYDTKIAFSQSKVFFYGNDGEIGGLWVSDGTSEGTKLLKQTYVSNLTFDDLGNFLTFFGGGSIYNGGLWKSDGTVNGTQMVSEKASETNISSHENDIIIIDGQIFFAAETERNGIELWKSDGTDEGTDLFYDFNKSDGVIPSLLTAVGDQLFFRGNEYGYYGLCTSDGTIEGTKYIDINLDGQSISDDSEFIDFNGKLFVSANDGVHGFELWTSDGTQQGTKMVKDINPGSASSMYNSSYVKTFTVINERLYFIADDGTYGAELWVTDGSEAGTYRITDISPGSGSSYPENLVWYKGVIYFSARNALYRTDGTPSGTAKVIGMHGLSSVKVVNNRLVMVANDPENTYGSNQIWFSDGTAEGTYFFDSYGGGIDSGIQYLTTLDDALYFVAFYPNKGYNPYPEFHGKSVFKTDGTPEGTTALFIGSEHRFSNVDIDVLLTCGDYVYFGVREGFSSDKELWRTNGTVEGTISIVTEEEGVFNHISELECFNGNLLFKQSVDSKKIFLATGETDEVYDLDINVTNNSSSPNYNYNLTKVGNRLFFDGSTEENGSEIYVAYPLNIEADSNLSDSDNDGVIDLFDECPDTPTGEEIDDVGCAQSQLDDDNDGVTNDLDQCPYTLPDDVVDGNGCSESDLLDSDMDGVNDTLDLCPSTPTGESVDENGCGQSQLDDDKDGVMNDRDSCPETLPIYNVDANGCPIIFDLPSNNFNIESIGVTCVGKNNGQLLITANEGYNYIARINNDEYSFTSELIVQNLYAGRYDLCITIPDQPDFIKCFGFEIADASEVSGKSSSTVSNQKLVETIEISSGTAPYTVFVNNNEKLVTMASSFSIEVDHGDIIKVVSKFPCEGVYETTPSLGVGISFAPNPTDDDVFVHLPYAEISNVQVSLYNSNMQLVKSEVSDLENYSLKVSLQGLPTGIYYVKLTMDKPIVFKIVKR